MTKKLLLSLLFTAAVSFSSWSQYYDTGEDPGSIRWLQIKRPSFRLVFPESYLNEGMKFAATLDSSINILKSYYPVKPTRIPVVLHNYTTFSNGYVAWAPKRMEIYPTPEQGSIPLDNTLQLTLHESAHLMQMSMLRKGFTKGLSFLLGEQAQGAAAALLPMWYMEGDAVFAETFFTNSGRGRTPSFERELKALAIERGGVWNYDKMLNGSYRNFTPDHYRYGYQLVNWVNSNYESDTWNKAVAFAGKFPFTVVPVNISLHRNTGMFKGGIYRQAFGQLSEKWIKEDSESGYREYPAVTPVKPGKYINYHSPVIIGNELIAAVKTSLSDPPRFVLINCKTGEEKRIHVPGNMYPYWISGNSSRITWVETVSDPRWNNRDYSVVKILEMTTGIVRQLTSKSRIMAVALSPDGRFIAAAENTSENLNSLLVLDAFNGAEINRFPAPSNYYLQRPEWSDSGNEITAIALTHNGEQIVSVTVGNGKWQLLGGLHSTDLKYAKLRGDTLWHIGAASGTDQVYYSLGGESYRVTASRFGIDDIAFSGNKIFFTNYSSDGKRISFALNGDMAVGADGDKTPLLTIDKIPKPSVTESTEKPEYFPERYIKAAHLIRLHSWMPVWADLEEIQSDPLSVRPGLTVMSQNDLSTLIASAGYEYSKEGFNKLHSRITWKGWYPVFTTEFDRGGFPSVYKSSSDPDPSTLKTAFSISNTLYIPLSFSNGKFSQYLMPVVSADFSNNYFYNRTLSVYDYGQMRLTTRLYFSNAHRSAYRDIYPRWAQVLDLNYVLYPFDREYYGTSASIKTAFFLPGIIKNHGLRLRVELEKQVPERVIMFNRINYPRAYANIISEKLRFASADYTFPLVYPDLNIPGIVFLKRIRGTAFYDFARGTRNIVYYAGTREDHNYTENFKSFGFELLADFNLLRIPFPVTAGISSAWIEAGTAPTVTPVFRIEIYGMKVGRNRMRDFRL